MLNDQLQFENGKVRNRWKGKVVPPWRSDEIRHGGQLSRATGDEVHFPHCSINSFPLLRCIGQLLPRWCKQGTQEPSGRWMREGAIDAEGRKTGAWK